LPKPARRAGQRKTGAAFQPDFWLTLQLIFRRQLDRMGYRLMKSRTRDPRDLTFGGYQIVEVQSNGLVAGWGNVQRGFGLDLDDVEDWLRE
jgi:hypothetical protein